MICGRAGLRHPVWLILAVLSWAAPLAGAQTKSSAPGSAPKPGVTVLKQTVRRVLVDVVVRDSEGNPVHGLTAKDFSVVEDGKPQRILSFDVYDFDKSSLSLPPNRPALPPNTFVNVPATPERGPLYVILYDMVNMEVEDQITARQQILKFISSKPTGTRFSIWVFSDELHLVQGFTDDKDLLFAALDPKNPAPHVPKSFLLSGNFGANDPISTMHVLTHIAEYLEGLPGRKNLIWMAGQFPVALYPHEGDPQDLRDDTRRELNALTRAEIAVYPVNIRGVVTNPEGALTGLTPYGGSTSVEQLQGSSAGGGGAGAASGTPPGGAPDRSTAGLRTASGLQTGNVSHSLSDDYMVETDVATATGGRAFLSNNDLKGALTEATEDGANYYSLSYAPTNGNYNGSLRRIRVTLKQAGYHLAYRRSYYADNPDAPRREETGKNENESDENPPEPGAEAHERPLYASLQHGAPLLHQLILKVRVHAVGAPALATPEQMEELAQQPAYTRGKKKRSTKVLKPVQIQKYAIYYAVVSKQVRLTDKRSIPLEFAVVGFDSDGQVVNGIFEKAADLASVQAGLPSEPSIPESWEPGVYRALQELDLPVTAISMRVAVRDVSTDRIGALEIPLPLAPEKETSETIIPSESAPSGTANPN